jgi:hypothetical protein
MISEPRGLEFKTLLAQYKKTKKDSDVRGNVEYNIMPRLLPSDWSFG